MKDDFIIALANQYNDIEGVNVNECYVVREYRESDRPKRANADEPEECNDMKISQIRSSFQRCKTKYTTDVYGKIQIMTNPTAVSNSLCQAATAIATTCMEGLRECSSQEDFLQTNSNEVTTMKAFLLRIASEKAGNDALDNCPGLAEAINPSDPVPHPATSPPWPPPPPVTRPPPTAPPATAPPATAPPATAPPPTNPPVTSPPPLEITEPDRRCDDERTTDLHDSFQDCNQKYTVQVFHKIQGMTDQTAIANSLCEAAAAIATTCMDIIKECESEEDFVHEKAIEMMTMKEYLIQIGQVSNNSLDDCQELEAAIHPDEDIEVVEPSPDPSPPATTQTPVPNPVTVGTAAATPGSPDESQSPDSQPQSDPSSTSVIHLLSINILTICLAMAGMMNV